MHITRKQTIPKHTHDTQKNVGRIDQTLFRFVSKSFRVQQMSEISFSQKTRNAVRTCSLRQRLAATELLPATARPSSDSQRWRCKQSARTSPEGRRHPPISGAGGRAFKLFLPFTPPRLLHQRHLVSEMEEFRPRPLGIFPFSIRLFVLKIFVQIKIKIKHLHAAFREAE